MIERKVETMGKFGSCNGVDQGHCTYELTAALDDIRNLG